MSEQSPTTFPAWTWRDRLRFRLFPSRHCELPEAPAAYKDCIIAKTVCVLDWMDRLRVLWSGRLVIDMKIVCEHTIGATKANSVVYPVLASRQPPPGPPVGDEAPRP